MSWGDFVVLFLGIVFGYSGIAKFFSISSFSETITHLGFSIKSSKPIAMCICLLECLSAFSLLFPFTRILGQALIMLLACGFLWSVYQANIVKKVKVLCSCFGSSTQEYLGKITVGKNVLFILVNALLFLATTPPNVLQRPLEEIALSVLIVIGLLLLHILVSHYIILHKMMIRRMAER